ncbi:MAG: hypothetical protein ABIG68_07885 [Acidobacteriota bacterium]
MRLDTGQIEVVDEAMAEVLKRKSPAERLRIGFAIWASARKMLAVVIRDAHPDWSQNEVEREVTRRMLLDLMEIWQAILRRLEEGS